MQGWTIKDKSVQDVTETEEIKKRWQKYTEEMHQKKVLITQTATMVWSLT